MGQPPSHHHQSVTYSPQPAAGEAEKAEPATMHVSVESVPWAAAATIERHTAALRTIALGSEEFETRRTALDALLGQ